MSCVPLQGCHVRPEWVPGAYPRRPRYELAGGRGAPQRMAMADEVFHAKLISNDGGLTGLDPISQMREGIGVALAAEMHVARYFGTGAQFSGVLTTEAQYDKDRDEELSKALEATHSSVWRHWRHLILWGGMKWQTNQSDNRAAQLEESASSRSWTSAAPSACRSG